MDAARGALAPLLPYLTDFNLRVAESVPLLPGLFMLTDMLHGQASVGFNKLGYVSHFATIVGIWKAGIASAMWLEGGAYGLLAQRMYSLHLGGVLFHHLVAERGSPASAIVPLAVLGMTVAVPVMRGELALPEAAGGALLLALLGWGIGMLVHSPKKQKAAAKAQ